MPDRPKNSKSSPPAGALVAHVVMVGAYVGAIGIALVLVAAPFVQWVVFGRLDVVVLLAVIVGVIMFRFLVPDPVRFDPSGPEVEREEQPELFDILDKVAAASRQPKPESVHLLDEMNLYLAEVGGFLGIGTRRIMGIGIPLMTVLDTEELGAAIVHEFGHLDRETGRVGPHVYATRQAVVRQVLDAPPSFVRRPLMAYARSYLRRTLPIVRQQELAADALAASSINPVAVGGTLARLPWGTVAFETYHRTEYLPLLRSERRPPMLDGFATFLTSAVAREYVQASASAALGSSTGSVLDGHPPVAERLAALGLTPDDIDTNPLPRVRSTELLRDLGRLEARFAARQVDGVVFDPIEWSAVGREILVPRWRSDRTALVGELPDGFHLGVLPIDREGLAELGADVAAHTGRELDADERVAQGHRAARAIIGEYAVDHGLGVEMVPGEPVWFGRAPDQFGLFAAYDAVVEGTDGPELWFDVLEESGLAVSTSPAPPAAAARVAVPTSSPTPSAVPSPVPPDPVAPAPVTPAPAPPPPASPPTEPVRPFVAAEPVAAAVPRRGGDPAAAIEAHRRKVFQLPGAIGRQHDLVLDGDVLTFRNDTMRAEDVTHVAYWSGDDPGVRLWVEDRQVRLRIGGSKKKEGADRAWEAVVAWIDAHVAPALVQRAMARLSERGRVQIGDQTVTTGGIVVRGRVVPWAVVSSAALRERAIEIRQRSEGDRNGEVILTLDATEPNMVLVPALMIAASAAAHDQPTEATLPPH